MIMHSDQDTVPFLVWKTFEKHIYATNRHILRFFFAKLILETILKFPISSNDKRTCFLLSPEKTKQRIYRQTEGYNQQVQAVMVRVMIHSDQDMAPFLVLSDLIDRVSCASYISMNEMQNEQIEHSVYRCISQ